MKKRTMVYGVLGLLFLFSLLFQLIWHPSHGLDHDEHAYAMSQNENIVAPAMIDSLRDITRVYTLQSGTIKKIHVSVGQVIKKGQLLFSLESALAENNVTIQKINSQQAKETLNSQEKHVNHLKHELARLKNLDQRAISRAELQQKIHEVNMGIIQRQQAENNVMLAKANLRNAELMLEQFHSVAPHDAVVLQINARINEFVGGAQPILLLGDAKKVIVRVSLDERDALRFSSKAQAYITSTGPDPLKIPLTFLQLDRYIVNQERLNSRVQEALYYFDRSNYPRVVAGQQFDATISIRKAV